MNEATVRGVVHLIEETKTYGQKGFRKRLVVLEQEQERFTNYIPVEFIQDACDMPDEFNVGDEVEIRYRLNGRRWQKDAGSEVKFFLNAEALTFKIVGAKSSGEKSGGEKSASGQGSGDLEAANDELAEAAGDDEPIPF